MQTEVLFMFTLGLLVLGVSFTIRLGLQADKEAFETLCGYLRIVRKVTAQELENALQEHTRLTAQQGMRIIDKLDGAVSNADRNAVREVLAGYTGRTILSTPAPVRALHIFVPPHRAQKWWTEFEEEWQTLRTHTITTLPAARRHIRRSQR
jgi:hypothetical protein